MSESKQKNEELSSKRNPGNGKREALANYRKTQAALAIARDFGYCVRCYWTDKLTQYEHVHHVFGRGTEVGDDREQYTSLICLCANCHRLVSAIRFRIKPQHTEQILLLERANENPINANFQHNIYEQD